VIADSDETIVFEGRRYFPPDSVKWKYLQESQTRTTCPRKGVARYYHLIVGSELNADAAWCHPSPKREAREIKGYIAFWHGVEVEE
jgi:uncharacterized protein (DUF427 family)